MESGKFLSGRPDEGDGRGGKSRKTMMMTLREGTGEEGTRQM